MMNLVLILIALAWSTWLFSGMSLSKNFKHKLLFLGFWVVASVASAVAYYQILGSDKEIQALVDSHQELKGLSLLELSEKIENKEIDLEALLAELRLRSEEKPDDPQQWLKLGNIFLQFEQYAQAEQAYSRAANLDGEHNLQLQVARSYMDHGTEQAFQLAQQHIQLVLLSKPQHEGALLLLGINFYQQSQYQEAIDAWQLLLARRNPSGEGAKVIQQQIALAQEKIDQVKNNRVQLIAENISNIPLRSFTKAFAVIRPAQGGTPIAVKSLSLEELQQPIDITPENTMFPDVDLWQVTDIKVEIRLSKSGFAKPATGDIYGESPVFSKLSRAQTIKIKLDKTVN